MNQSEIVSEEFLFEQINLNMAYKVNSYIRLILNDAVCKQYITADMLTALSFLQDVLLQVGNVSNLKVN